MTANQLPIFVYGTLKQGGYWANRLWPKDPPNRVKPAHIRGHLHALSAYPVLTAGSDYVRGELHYVDEQAYEETLRALDQLELGAGYKRIVVEAKPDGHSRPTRAWVYIQTDANNLPTKMEPNAAGVVEWTQGRSETASATA